MKVCIWMIICCFIIMPLQSTDLQQPIELGKVKWNRNYDESIKKAAKLNIPVLILFQEVPGCATCSNYGKQVLSHPLIVDLIHSQFIPVAIYNNKGGEDAKVLKKYNEPSWNNPVVRIVSHDEEDLVPRVNGKYTPIALVQAIKTVLLKQKKVIPEYLYLLEDELTAQHKQTDETTYSMYCFWSGEKLFGALNGVVKTRAGWANGKEVVKVTYRPDLISKKQLDKVAQQNSYSVEEVASNFRDDREPKYYLTNSLYRYIPLSENQASKINSLLGAGENPFDLLSPTQQKWYIMIQKKGAKHFEDLVQVDLESAWQQFEESMRRT